MSNKNKILFFIILLFSDLNCHTQIFNTSKCFDLLCAPQYIEKYREVARFAELFNDTLFINSISDLNSKTRASQLCNLYSELGGNKDDVEQCMAIVQNLDSVAVGIEWANNILSVQPQLYYVLNQLVRKGYSDYWENNILYNLQSQIDNYPLNHDLLESIDSSITNFAHPEILPDTYSNIFILDIENAFNLSDESFCCTPLILNPEIEKQLRLNFVNTYIHENLHNLSISSDLMIKLGELNNDPFYKENEERAKKHNEGGNEAFIVAAEVFISNKLGLRDIESVYNEFLNYIEGSLVLAPIIYVNLPSRKSDETYNDFILRLFDDDIIKIGNIERIYNDSMNLIKAKVNSL